METWKPIAEWSDRYEVSSLGNVRRTGTGRILRPMISRGGIDVKVQLCRPGTRRTVAISRTVAAAFLVGFGEAEQVDHIDGDRSNNRVENLRLVTRAQNAKNRKLNANNVLGLKGVSFHKRRQRYIARIQADGRRIEIGSFLTAAEAAGAYDQAEVRLFGEYARAKEARRATR